MLKRLVVGLFALSMVAAACGSNADEEADTGGDSDVTVDTGGDSSTTTGDGAGGEVAIDDAVFGTIDAPCGPKPDDVPEPTAGEDQGVAADSISIAVIADVEGPVQGLNKEAADGTQAFVEWCNSLGGINGRTLDLTLLDSKLLEYAQRAEDACGFAFAVVGQGAVFDNTGIETLEGCDMPLVPAYTLSPEASTFPNMVQSNPNPPDTFLVSTARQIAADFPEAVKNAGIITAAIPTTQQQLARQKEAYETVGWEYVWEGEQAVAEQNWGPIVQEMQAAGVQVLNHVAEPTEHNNMLTAMVNQGIDLSELIVVHNPNFYDQEYLELAGANAAGQYIEFGYTPFEEADTNPATAEFIEILDQFGGYFPSLIAMQAFSSSLLFANSVKALGADVTRAGLLEDLKSVHEWDAGGLTGPQDPGANTRGNCAMTMKVNDDGTGYERYAPEEGLDCDDANVAAITYEPTAAE